MGLDARFYNFNGREVASARNIETFTIELFNQYRMKRNKKTLTELDSKLCSKRIQVPEGMIGGALLSTLNRLTGKDAYEIAKTLRFLAEYYVELSDDEHGTMYFEADW